eukprot:CAMPEP_0198240224 /NCGR_PEP_ID=MMETSP1446-20131203/5416_1 /TAXON_ID=1461542 ORGANISM="Unidentified sp, Strain CCMP2111" /NCGR_SAMPLE_ID=MMETSP1446 /ASSEMBLY_ACC=CAM_ASM_001112 /LENGTH=32 /DNA_ID= /DNA_START= /DNA_END= /DNA_ORIENTATION=
MGMVLLKAPRRKHPQEERKRMEGCCAHLTWTG